MLRRPVRENVSLASLRSLGRFGFVRRGMESTRAKDALRQVAAPGSSRRSRRRSPGATSRSSCSRAPCSHPAVLIADEPTRGVDVGAKRDIYELIVNLAAGGVAILLISNEIEEVLGLAHRVVVMRGGRISAELRADAITEEAILAASFGRASAA